MALVILIIHLLVCVCLIGLVLLQRSEGGALGMGGGGGALMSGRGAADALAKMTQVAGGFFLLTSLGLTILSGAASNSVGRSVFDTVAPPPIHSTPSTTTTPPPAGPATPAHPDPTQSDNTAADRTLASIVPGPASASASVPTAPAVSGGSARAAPLPANGGSARATTPPNGGASTVPASANGGAVTTRPPTPAHSTPATPPPTTRPLVIPNTSGGVSGITLSDSGPTAPESSDGGVQPVRRERAGPDQ